MCVCVCFSSSWPACITTSSQCDECERVVNVCVCVSLSADLHVSLHQANVTSVSVLLMSVCVFLLQLTCMYYYIKSADLNAFSQYPAEVLIYYECVWKHKHTLMLSVSGTVSSWRSSRVCLCVSATRWSTDLCAARISPLWERPTSLFCPAHCPSRSRRCSTTPGTVW